MYRRDDPRFRRQLTQLSHNFENANEAAQERLYSLTEHCLKPCFKSIGDCVTSSTGTYFPRREDRARRSKPRPRGRPEASFDFYDDWEQDESDALLTWENDEYEGLLNSEDETEPGRRGIMSYGTRNDARNQRTRPRRLGMPYDEQSPTYIPKTSYFGFLERMPFKMGARGLRYRPSAADLKIRPKESAKADDESSGQDESSPRHKRKHGRKRSLTNGSERSEDSFSSRGDLFPSDDEDDAVPLDDTFAMELERHGSASAKDDSSSGKTRSSNRRSVSGKIKRTASSKTAGSNRSSMDPDSEPVCRQDMDGSADNIPTMSDLNNEEEEVRAEEEQEVKTKRDAAHRLAEQRGLTLQNGYTEVDSEDLQQHQGASIQSNEDFTERQKPP